MTALFVVEDAPRPDTSFFPAGPISAHWSEADRRLLVYADDDDTADRVAAALPSASRHALVPLSRIAGAGAGESPAAHYVVWTDAADGWWDEMNAWYEEEHLPGLAGVPGAVRARRFRNPGPGPAHLACYDLAAPEVLGSPPWLRVRGTDWSSRVRPNFRNTRRWMTETLFDRTDWATS